MDDHEADDDHLMARVAERRDRRAFGSLVARHLGGVHRYLTRMTANHADADDLVQETFLRLWQNAASYRPGAARLSTWLHRIAHNLAVDELRRRRTVPFGHADDSAADGSGVALDDLTAAAEVEPPVSLEAERTRRRLDQALALLPPNQRAALLLCQVQGFSQQEAAVILGSSAAAVESLVARARRTLRLRLQNDTPTPATERPS